MRVEDVFLLTREKANDEEHERAREAGGEQIAIAFGRSTVSCPRSFWIELAQRGAQRCSSESTKGAAVLILAGHGSAHFTCWPVEDRTGLGVMHLKRS